MTEYIIYNTVSEFLVDMVSNDDCFFSDKFGRRWKYRNYRFYFANINEHYRVDNIQCLHLFQTGIKRI